MKGMIDKMKTGVAALLTRLGKRRKAGSCDYRSRRSEAGFTQVEMLVVITIIGLIMGLVGPRVLSYLSDSKVKTAQIQIQGFSSALDLFYLDNGAIRIRRKDWGRWPSDRMEPLPGMVLI